jgi:hypothetical protein
MLIKACFECKFHRIKSDDDEQKSYCGKECCWSVLTNCITQKAIERFLIEESRPTAVLTSLNDSRKHHPLQP